LINMLEVKNLTVSYGDLKIVDNVGFFVEKGQWMMVVGPNGAGKSTIINAVSQGVKYSGSVTFEGKDVKKMKPVQIAKKIGVLTQNHYVGYSFTVEDIVRLGRYAYSIGVFTHGEDDEEKIDEALELTGMRSFRNSSALTLSGGEMQRVFLAQIIAQDPKLFILDEPTNHLDLVYQKQTFELIKEWIRHKGRAVISVVHDLSLAKLYGTNAVLLDKGRMAASGSVENVLTVEKVNPVYGMDVRQWMNDLLSQW